MRPDPARIAAAQEALSRGATLVDVRTPGEFAGGHLPNARNVPLQGLERRLDECGSREGEVVLYCRSGSRSAMAARKLRGAGFATVIDAGGIGGLQAAMAAGPLP
ncbi:MAG: rhodanese-like domain-containing protein [Myxococcales bacterium]|nr:rhodanese-like domain-containing protein [Myxococcales bacterium]